MLLLCISRNMSMKNLSVVLLNMCAERILKLTSIDFFFIFLNLCTRTHCYNWNKLFQAIYRDSAHMHLLWQLAIYLRPQLAFWNFGYFDFFGQYYKNLLWLIVYLQLNDSKIWLANLVHYCNKDFWEKKIAKQSIFSIFWWFAIISGNNLLVYLLYTWR